MEKEIKIDSKTCLDQRLENFELKEFIEKTLNKVKEELTILRKTIYNYKEHHYLFALNERAWVGIINNAIIKAFPKNSSTLQEFSVTNQKGFVGRADFLVCWKNKTGKEYYLLFEAKQYEEKNISKIYDDPKDDYCRVFDQAQKYYEAEFSYYKSKKVYIIPIFIGWIRSNPKLLQKAKEYFTIKEKTDKSTDFCCLYYEGDYGTWIYGKICLPKTVKKS